MFEGSVLHQGRGGGGQGDVVGISWKVPTNSHPSPSLIVTCSHKVIVYKPIESRLSHQWSFKPSAATVLSHAAVYLPAGSRFVGVQQGSTLVSWRESELDVKRPLSSQAKGAVQSVHACPQLGDFFVVVLASGRVTLYDGGLQSLAHCDAAGEGHNNMAANSKPKTVWSGVRGSKVLVLQNIGDIDRLTTFVLSVGSNSSRTSGGGGKGGADNSAASVTLVSSHILAKPSPRLAETGINGYSEKSVAAGGEEASACSAAFLGRGGVSGGQSVVSVAWQTSRGPMWTKVVVRATGAMEELARPAGAAAAAVDTTSDSANGSTAGATVGVSNGKIKSKKMSVSHDLDQSVVVAGKPNGDGFNNIPAIAAADGGLLLVHSGGASPRLAIWDATYGVLLEDNMSPETNNGSSARAGTKAISMKVSGDGAHLALAVSGRVLLHNLPMKQAGTLASLLRRKRPVVARASVGGLVTFPSVDLARNFPASNLLEQTGTLEAGKWEAAVVLPFREVETEVVRSLQDAARRKDANAFECILREHLQQRLAATAFNGQGGDEKGRRRRRQDAHGDSGGYSAGVVSAAVHLCLAHPEAGLWSALSLLLKSGGVSARHHRGLVSAIVENASTQLLEEVMLHVPDLPEADAVRILRYFLARAAAGSTTKTTADLAASATSSSETPVKKGDGGDAPSAKRARSGLNGSVSMRSSHSEKGASDDDGGNNISSKRGAGGSKKRKHRNVNVNALVEISEEGEAPPTTTAPTKKADKPHFERANGTATANGRPHDGDRGSLSESGGGSESLRGKKQPCTPSGTTENDNGMAVETTKDIILSSKDGKNKKVRGGGELSGSVGAAAALAERGVRVALTLPHNDAFLRSALAGLSHSEVVVVLKVLTRLLSEGRTRESTRRGAKPRGKNAIAITRGLPSARTASVLGWASALLDSHFTRLAMGGAADADLVGALTTLKEAVREEAQCCELLSQVRSLVDEVGRRHAAEATEKARRRPKRDLFTLRVLRF